MTPGEVFLCAPSESAAPSPDEYRGTLLGEVLMRRNIAMTLVTAFPAHFPCAQNSGSESKPMNTNDKSPQPGPTDKFSAVDATKRLPPLARAIAETPRS